jgi:cation:H+ antiporter
MLFTLLAVLFFTGAVWALGRDGQLTFNDGLVLVGCFCSGNASTCSRCCRAMSAAAKSPGWSVGLNLALLGVGAYASYVSIDWLVAWLGNIARPVFQRKATSAGSAVG